MKKITVLFLLVLIPCLVFGQSWRVKMDTMYVADNGRNVVIGYETYFGDSLVAGGQSITFLADGATQSSVKMLLFDFAKRCQMVFSVASAWETAFLNITLTDNETNYKARTYSVTPSLDKISLSYVILDAFDAVQDSFSVSVKNPESYPIQYGRNYLLKKAKEYEAAKNFVSQFGGYVGIYITIN